MVWPMNWEGYAWVIWLCAFGVLEFIGLVKHGNAMTLTFFIQHHVPRWALAAFIGWLTYHFLVAKGAMQLHG
jgi:hypothetical protein